MKYLIIAFLILTNYSYGVEKIEYKVTPQSKLFLHTFKPANWKPEDRRPAVIFFFGGGWEVGSPKHFYRQCKHFTKLGLVTFSAEYRIKSKHNTTPFDAVEDAKSAMIFLRQNYSKLGINPDQIIASGGSAGGHLALSTAAIDGFIESPSDKKLAEPNALVLFNPALDLTKLTKNKERFNGKENLISPFQHIHKNMPPTLILVGDNDKITPHTVAEDFQKKMKEYDNTCELKIYKDQGHGFFNKEDMCLKTVKEAEAFLRELKIIN